jgi:hypothetical protein
VPCGPEIERVSDNTRRSSGGRDEHINQEIIAVAEAEALPRRAIEDVRYIGSSTWPLRTSFTNDELERAKLMRFFET